MLMKLQAFNVQYFQYKFSKIFKDTFLWNTADDSLSNNQAQIVCN